MRTYVEEFELEIDPVPLASGGTADILRCTWDGNAGLYKRYKPDYLPKVNAGALARLVQWRADLPREDRQQLDARCAWPTTMVGRRGKALGLLMPHASAGFSLASAGTGTLRSRTLSDLRRLDPDLPPGEVRSAAVEALAAFGLTAQAMFWLHDHGVVFNDVQPLNVLVSPDAGRVYFVDCDAMMGAPWGLVGPPAAPAYFNELITDPPSPAVDLAKLAWCMFFILLEDFSLRGLGPDVQQQAMRYLPTPTVDLLVRTALRKEDLSVLRVPWAERASQWINCGRSGILVTDAGWLAVAAERPATLSAYRTATVPRAGTPRATAPTAALPTELAPATGRSRPRPAASGARPRRQRRAWAVAAATAAFVIVVAILAGGYFIS